MAQNIVGRGYALIYGAGKVSAVVSGPEAAQLQKRVGGRVVNVKGQPFRYAQSRQVRVLINQDAVRALPSA